MNSNDIPSLHTFLKLARQDGDEDACGGESWFQVLTNIVVDATTVRVPAFSFWQGSSASAKQTNSTIYLAFQTTPFSISEARNFFRLAF